MFICFFAAAALADESQPHPMIQFMSGVTYAGIVRPEVVSAPPALLHGVNVSVPLGDGWVWSIEGDLATSFTALRPSGVILTGPTKKFGSDFALGVTAFAKATPPYDGAPETFTTGVTVVPVVPLGFGSLAFPTGLAWTPSVGTVSVVSTVKVGIRLP